MFWLFCIYLVYSKSDLDIIIFFIVAQLVGGHYTNNASKNLNVLHEAHASYTPESVFSGSK